MLFASIYKFKNYKISNTCLIIKLLNSIYRTRPVECFRPGCKLQVATPYFNRNGTRT